jgi:copper chaperone
MESLKFKTNIKCSGCIAATTPFLNELAGENKWSVDVQDPNKILTVNTEKNISAQDVINTIQKAGYTAEKI